MTCLGKHGVYHSAILAARRDHERNIRANVRAVALGNFCRAGYCLTDWKFYVSRPLCCDRIEVEEAPCNTTISAAATISRTAATTLAAAWVAASACRWAAAGSASAP